MPYCVYFDRLLDPKSVENLKNVRIFDTYAVKEISKNSSQPQLISNQLLEEMREIGNENIFIVPIFRPQGVLYLLIIEIDLSSQGEYQFRVTLYDRDREYESEEKEDQESQYASDMIMAFLQLIVGEEVLREYEDEIQTSTQQIDVESDPEMIPAILQTAEQEILYDGDDTTEMIYEAREKILDRLIGFHQIWKNSQK